MNSKKGKKLKKTNSDDGDEYILEGTSEKQLSFKKNDDGGEDHSELVYADSKSHSYRLDPNADEDMKEGSEMAKDNVPTYEMNISAEDRTDPMYGVVPESDSSSNRESIKKREMKKQQQKYGLGEFSMPKQMPYGSHAPYSELFPVFCAECSGKVDTAFIYWGCRGHCGKVYHDRCKKSLDNYFRGRVKDSNNESNEWLCWLCREGKAECFICKKFDIIKWNPKKPIPSYIRNNPDLINKLRNTAGPKSEPMGRIKEENPDVYQKIHDDDAWKNTDRKSKNNEPHLVKSEDGQQKETEFKFQFESETPFPTQFVSCNQFII